MLPIHVAASNGRLEIIKRLLKACHHCMCSRNASGQSFLHVAVEKKWVGVVRHVCKEQTLDGILNLQDQDGNTALHLAVKSGYQLIFCFLMSNPGVCLNLANKEGHTPRDLATLAIDPHLKLLQVCAQYELIYICVYILLPNSSCACQFKSHFFPTDHCPEFPGIDIFTYGTSRS